MITFSDRPRLKWVRPLNTHGKIARSWQMNITSESLYQSRVYTLFRWNAFSAVSISQRSSFSFGVGHVTYWVFSVPSEPIPSNVTWFSRKHIITFVSQEVLINLVCSQNWFPKQNWGHWSRFCNRHTSWKIVLALIIYLAAIQIDIASPQKWIWLRSFQCIVSDQLFRPLTHPAVFWWFPKLNEVHWQEDWQLHSNHDTKTKGMVFRIWTTQMSVLSQVRVVPFGNRRANSLWRSLGPRTSWD